MLIFAQPSDVEKWTGETLPEQPPVAPLIRRASSMVQHAVRAARFDITPAGMPSDPDIMDSLRDAVCEQVAVWVENDINPTRIEGATAAVTASSIGDASFTLSGESAANTKDGAANYLCAASVDILANAGLIGGAPYVPAGGEKWGL